MTSPEVVRRRAGRIAFGAGLLAGVVAMFATGGTHTARILELTWAVAFAAATVARMLPTPRRDLFTTSLVVPAVGLALVLPLSLHLVVMLALREPTASFDDWVQVSLLCVGFAHVVFAILFGTRASQLARTAAPPMKIRSIYGWSVLASTAPGLLLFAIPVALTAVTGLFVLPVIAWFDQIAARERATLPLLPRAKVV